MVIFRLALTLSPGAPLPPHRSAPPLRLDTRLAWDLSRVRPIVRLDIPGQARIQLPKVPGRIRGRLDRSIYVPAYLITALE